jgi:hypothetical protein
MPGLSRHPRQLRRRRTCRQCQAKDDLGMPFRPVAEFGQPPEASLLVQCRCLEVMTGHPSSPNTASRRLNYKGVRQFPHMTMSTLGLVNPHQPDLGCARPEVAHGSSNDTTFSIMHHEAQCTTVIPTYGALVALIETVLDRFCLNWRIVWQASIRTVMAQSRSATF